MNTTTTFTSTPRVVLGTAIAALCFGAAACGSQQAADPAGSIKQAGSQQQSRISPRVAEHQAELGAQAQKRAARGHEAIEHPPGSFHADTQCRREGHPTRPLIMCTSTAPSDVPSEIRSGGSQKYPDLRP